MLFVGSIDILSRFSYSCSIYMSKGSIFRLLSDLSVILPVNGTSLLPCLRSGLIVYYVYRYKG